MPHDVGFRKTVQQQDGRSAPLTTDEDRCVADVHCFAVEARKEVEQAVRFRLLTSIIARIARQLILARSAPQLPPPEGPRNTSSPPGPGVGAGRGRRQ